MTFQVLLERLAARGFKAADSLTANEYRALENLATRTLNGEARGAEGSLVALKSGYTKMMASMTKTMEPAKAHDFLIKNMKQLELFGQGSEAIRNKDIFERLVRDSLKDAESAPLAARAPRQAVASAAQELSQKLQTQISDQARIMERAVGHSNRADWPGYFESLAGLLRSSPDSKLVRTLEETGRAKELGSYQSIARAIKEGKKVTEDEFFALAGFFDANLSQSAARAAMQATTPYPVAGGKLQAAITAAEKISARVGDSLPPTAKKPDRNIMALWTSEERAMPGWGSRQLNNFGYKGYTATVSALALTAGIAINYNYVSDLHIAGPLAQVRTMIADWVLPDDPATAAAADNSDVVGAIYQRMVKSGSRVKPDSDFERLTTNITGSGFFNAKEKEKLKGFGSLLRDKDQDPPSQDPITFDSFEKIEILRLKLQKVGTVTPGVSGDFTDLELTAYKLYLSQSMRTASKTDEKGVPVPWKPSADTGELFESWAIRVAEQMNATPKLRNQILNAYYGVDNPTDDQLRNMLHSQRGKGTFGQDSAMANNYFSAISHYLVLSGVVPTLADAKDPEKIAKVTSKLGLEQAEARAVATANDMNKNADVRKQMLTAYYGRDDLDDTALIKGFIESRNKDPQLRLAIGQYLVLMGAIKRDQLSVEGQKELAAAITGKEAALETAKKDTVEAEGDRINADSSVRAAEERLRRLGRPQQPPAAAPATSGAKPRSLDEVTTMFNQMAADDDFAPLKGKARTLVDTFKSAKSGQEFEQQLRTRDPSIPPAMVRKLSEYAYAPQ